MPRSGQRSAAGRWLAITTSAFAILASAALAAPVSADVLDIKRVKTSKLHVVFTHRGKSRSGLTELEAWRE